MDPTQMTNTEAKVRKFRAQWSAGPVMSPYPQYGDVVLASDHDAAIAALAREVEEMRERVKVAINEFDEFVRDAAVGKTPPLAKDQADFTEQLLDEWNETKWEIEGAKKI